MLSQINVVSKTLQTELYSLTDCRFDLNELTAAFEEAITDTTKMLHGCKLGTTYIGTDYHLFMNENFETGVVPVSYTHLTLPTILLV